MKRTIKEHMRRQEICLHGYQWLNMVWGKLQNRRSGLLNLYKEVAE